MPIAFALLCFSALDAGRYGEPFATHGVEGVPVWEQYRRSELTGAAMFAPVSLSRDGGALTFTGVRQGCAGPDCATLTPGVFISRAASTSSPAFSPVYLGAPDIDLRLALVEADVDGGLSAFVAAGGGDLGARMDPFFPLGVDGLIMHARVGADGPGRLVDLRQVNCMTAAGSANEAERTNYEAELTSRLSVFPEGAAITWGLADAGPGQLAFTVLADGATVWRWQFPTTRLERCGNPDDAGYSDGVLELSRLVPVLYVGWGVFLTPADTTTLTMEFRGHAPRFEPLPATSPQGATLAITHALVFADGSIAKGVATPITLRIDGPEPVAPVVSTPGLQPNGLSTTYFAPTIPGEYRLTLELAGADVATERIVQVTAIDGSRKLNVGCGCQSTPGAALLLALASCLRRRRGVAAARSAALAAHRSPERVKE